jgi:hypothetical protein
MNLSDYVDVLFKLVILGLVVGAVLGCGLLVVALAYIPPVT